MRQKFVPHQNRSFRTSSPDTSPPASWPSASLSFCRSDTRICAVLRLLALLGIQRRQPQLLAAPGRERRESARMRASACSSSALCRSGRHVGKEGLQSLNSLCSRPPLVHRIPCHMMWGSHQTCHEDFRRQLPQGSRTRSTKTEKQN